MVLVGETIQLVVVEVLVQRVKTLEVKVITPRLLHIKVEMVVLEDQLIFQFLVHLFFMLVVVEEEFKIILNHSKVVVLVVLEVVVPVACKPLELLRLERVVVVEVAVALV